MRCYFVSVLFFAFRQCLVSHSSDQHKIIRFGSFWIVQQDSVSIDGPDFKDLHSCLLSFFRLLFVVCVFALEILLQFLFLFCSETYISFHGNKLTDSLNRRTDGWTKKKKMSKIPLRDATNWFKFVSQIIFFDSHN